MNRIRNQVKITVHNTIFKNLEHVVNKINSKITQFKPYAGYLDRDQDREPSDDEEGKR